MTIRVRPARLADEAEIESVTRDTWPDRPDAEYVADVFESWVAASDEPNQTFVASVEGAVVGVIDVLLLSEWEAWLRGMRVAPGHRGQGVALELTRTALEWATERGAAVARNLVFGWNEAGLSLSARAGFDPLTEFRWVTLDASSETAAHSRDATVNAAWAHWQRSWVRGALEGLTLHPEHRWTLATLSRRQLLEASEDDRLLTPTAESQVDRANGPCSDQHGTGFAVCTRTHEQPDTAAAGQTVAIYGVAAWESCQDLFEAVASDADSRGADRARILVPETARALTAAVEAGGTLGDDPEIVFSSSLGC